MNMLKRVSRFALALALGWPLVVGGMNLREMAGCKPGSDDPVVSREGLFTAHMACDHLLLEIPDSVYERDLLVSTEFAAISGGSDLIAPGTLVSNRIVRLMRRGNRVNLEAGKYDIASEREQGICRAVAANSLPTLLQRFE